mmetsp:Transcript_89484/g.156437  ORF Transcript_89484/g.156437 Transcript_89484/m.156437 type:complete len:214 (+) Transcript_89484:233-874(+)
MMHNRWNRHLEPAICAPSWMMRCTVLLKIGKSRPMYVPRSCTLAKSLFKVFVPSCKKLRLRTGVLSGRSGGKRCQSCEKVGKLIDRCFSQSSAKTAELTMRNHCSWHLERAICAPSWMMHCTVLQQNGRNRLMHVPRSCMLADRLFKVFVKTGKSRLMLVPTSCRLADRLFKFFVKIGKNRLMHVPIGFWLAERLLKVFVRMGKSRLMHVLVS